MDFMKVFDQAVRDITREVNLKVLKIPEIEQKVLDATSDEPWGPHGSDLAEIARATKSFTESELIMNVIRSRLRETGRNWRYVYKALTVVEYLIAHGSDRIVDDIIEITHRIASVAEFEYVEPNGKDMGINVRKKAQTVLALLHNKDKIREVREKAAANRDKYIGLSSTGITYKSNSSTYGGSGVHWSDRDETFADSYRSKDYNGSGTDNKSSFKDDFYKEIGEKSGRGNVSETECSSSRKNRGKYGSASKETMKQYSSNNGHGSVSASQNSKTSQDCVEDDFDPRGPSSAGGQNEFDPRGSSSAGTATAKSGHEDLFNKSLIDDLIDIHTDVATENISIGSSAVPEVDLFAGANFVSASPHVDAGSDSHSQVECDLFAHQPAASASFAPTVDLFASSEPVLPSAAKLSSESTKMPVNDPFASVLLNTFQDSDLFGAFTSGMDTQSSNPSKVETLPTESKGNSTVDGLKTQARNSLNESKPPSKDTFQVKSSIWADSLSRGLIDLNISAPNKTSLVDIGIVGGLNDGSDQRDEKDWTLPASFQMGKAMGTGSGLGRAGFTSTSSSDGTFPDLRQQFGSFK